jgi:hypothetical protein
VCSPPVVSGPIGSAVVTELLSPGLCNVIVAAKTWIEPTS